MDFNKQFQIAKLHVQKMFNLNSHVEEAILRSWSNQYPKVSKDLKSWGMFCQHRNTLAQFDTEKEWEIFLNTLKVKKIATPRTLYNQLTVDYDREHLITLSDGTKVWLNSLSSLKYPVTFNRKKRIVELTGEAYFEVVHDAQHPFIVKTTDYNIRVLGTSFNISCYKSDNGVVATLLNGAVNIEEKKGIEKQNFKLTPDKQFIYNKHQRSTTIKEVDAQMFCSWAKGKFWMDNESLESLMTKIQRWYDINVFFLDETVKKEVFTGVLPRFKEFHSLAKMIEQVSNVEIEINDKTVKIKTKN
ncbi:FecR family protein [Prolixibacteraceae bacterium JC049]|nr:FecR family protein [Prolixibacteraceae bacterium JC049]